VHRAERLRDATHVRHYTRNEFVVMARAAGLRVVREERFAKRHAMGDWLSGTGCEGDRAEEVKRLLAHVAEPGGAAWTDTKWVAQAVKEPAAR
jgi:hypothetical protein